MTITVEISNYDKVMKQLENCPKDLAKGVRSITLGFVKRNKSGGNSIKSIASKHVRKVYNISKAEFDSRTSDHYEETGSISLSGVDIPFFQIEFKSSPNRTFTPIHFGMKPASRQGAKRGYTVTWKPAKGGGERRLHPPKGQVNPVFLAAPRGVTLPWYRLGERHKPIEVARTHLSPPQMIDNSKVQPNIQAEVNEKVQAKLDKLIEKLNG